jgi:hypothetical protein
LEVVADPDAFDLDTPHDDHSSAAGIHEDMAQPLSHDSAIRGTQPFEPVTEEVEFEAAEIEEALEEPGESVRQTEPFPIKPAEGGGDWDFLKKKK